MKSGGRWLPTGWVRHLLLENPANRIRLWGYLAILTLLLMEATAYTLWYQALFGIHSVLWGGIFAVLFAILAITVLIARIAENLHWRLLARQGLLLAWILVAIFASEKLLLFSTDRVSLFKLISDPFRFIIRGDLGASTFYHLIVIALITWRGILAAHSPATFNDASRSFQLGLIFLLLYGMFFAPLYPAEAAFGLYSFLFYGLVAVAAARIFSISDMRGGRIPRFGSGWMVSILLAGLIIVGLSLLGGQLASQQVIEIANTIILVIFSILTAIFLLLLSPFLALIAQLVNQLLDLVNQIIAALQSVANNPGIKKLIEQISQGIERLMPFVQTGRSIILIVLLALIVAIILFAIRYRDRFKREVKEEAESDSASGETSHGFGNLLRRLLDRAPKLRLHRPGQLLAAARIRQIYRSLMILSQKLGQERPASCTPLEFLPNLRTLFPEQHPGLDLITSAYINVRYGAFPETYQEVEVVEKAWEAIRREGHNLLAQIKKQKRNK